MAVKKYIAVDPKAVYDKDGPNEKPFTSLSQSELKEFHDAGHYHLVSIAGEEAEENETEETGATEAAKKKADAKKK